jgi:hypothetical protein
MVMVKYVSCVKCVSDHVLGQCTAVHGLKTPGYLFE